MPDPGRRRLADHDGGESSRGDHGKKLVSGTSFGRTFRGRSVQPRRPQQIQLGILWRHPAFKRDAARACHREQVAIPPRPCGVGSPGALSPWQDAYGWRLADSGSDSDRSRSVTVKGAAATTGRLLLAAAWGARGRNANV